MTKAEVLLGRLIEERLTPGADVAGIDARIRSEFEEEWCIVHTIMNGPVAPPSAGTILEYLCLVHEMKRMTRPIMEANNGIVIKSIADRFVAIFRRPHDALGCLLQVNRRLAAYNDGRGPESRIAIGAGVGFGKVLKVGNEDVYGAEANLALRLGGELARPYDILLSDAARAALLHTPGVGFEPMEPPPGFLAFRTLYDLSRSDARPV